MQLKPTLIGLAAALLVGGAAPVLAQSSAQIDEMMAEIKRLRQEVDELKKSKAAETAKAPAPAAKATAEAKPGDPGWGDRVELLEIRQRDAVTMGDIPGGFRLPGSETSLRIYGYAEAHVIHDFKQTSTPDVFTDPTYQPLNNAGGLTGQTQWTAETSRLGFETSTPTSLGTFNTKLEGDFYAYNNDAGRNRFRLRQAYGEYGGWLIGQTWSTFMDLDDLPETVDFNGPIGAPFSRVPMIRYTYGDPKAGYKLTFALEDPAGSQGAYPAWPQAVARYDQAFDGGQFNVRGLVTSVRSDTETKAGYGFGIGGSYKLTGQDVLMGQYTIAEGPINNLYGSNGYSIATDGAITFDRNQGLVVGWARTWNEQLRSNVVYGGNFGKTATDQADNRRLHQVFINMIYSPIKNVELGAEYIWGLRETFTDGNGTLSRFDLMGRYSF